MAENNITPVEAESFMRILLSEGADLSDVRRRSINERLAIGTVFWNRTVAGATQRSIASEFNTSPATVNRYLKLVIETLPPIAVSEDRHKMIGQIDELLDVWLPKAKLGDEKAVAAVSKLMDQRAKVAGTYAPIEVNQTTVEISAQDRELQELVAQEERKNRFETAPRDEDSFVEEFDEEETNV